MSKGATDNREALATTLARLRRLAAKIPKTQGDWSYDRSRDFKSAHADATKCLGGGKVTLERASNALSRLNAFFPMEDTE